MALRLRLGLILTQPQLVRRAIRRTEVATPLINDLRHHFIGDAFRIFFDLRQCLEQYEIARRTSTFEEVVQGLDETNALYEARRCLSCGNCFECDNCYGMCPDNAVIKLGSGKGFEFNDDVCKGCGICAQECPCGAINMVAESI